MLEDFEHNSFSDMAQNQRWDRGSTVDVAGVELERVRLASALEAIKADVRTGHLRRALEIASTGSASHGQLRLIASVLQAHAEALAASHEDGSVAPVDAVLEALACTIPDLASNGGTLVSFGKCGLQLGYPTADTVALQTAPKRIDLQPRIVSVAAATHHTLAVDDAGRVWAWGHGQHGRLGLGDQKPRIEPALVRELGDAVVSAVAVGRDHSLAVTHDGRVFAWGSNERGQLGVSALAGKGSASFPRRVKLPRDDADAHTPRARLVAASATHSVCVDAAGRPYAWGANDKGQLGFRDPSASGSAPRAVPGTRRWDDGGVDAVCASEGVTLFLSRSGGVFQVGHGLSAPTRVPIRLSGDDASAAAGEAGWGFGGRGRDSSVRVRALACGPNHAAAVTVEGLVFTWGTSAALLGHAGKGLDRDSRQAHTTRPRFVAALRGRAVRQVACARHHTCAVDDTGRLYTWGDGDKGALGTAQTYQPEPSRVPGLRRVVAVTAADGHTVALVRPTLPSFAPLGMAARIAAQALPHAACDAAVTQHAFVSSAAEDSDGEEEAAAAPVVHVVSSLQDMCEQRMSARATTFNALAMWEFAEQLRAPSLSSYCERFVAANLDAVLEHTRDACQRLATLSGGCSALVRDRAQDGLAASANADAPSDGKDLWASPRAGPKQAACLQDGALGKMSAQRLRKSLEALRRQTQALEATQLQRMGATPDRRSRHLEDQLQDCAAQQARFEAELALRDAASVAPQKLAPGKTLGRGGSAPSGVAAASVGDALFCRACNVRANSADTMVEHVSGKRHRREQAKLQEREQREQQLQQSRTHASPVWGPSAPASKDGAWATVTTPLQQQQLRRGSREQTTTTTTTKDHNTTARTPPRDIQLPAQQFPQPPAAGGLSLSDFMSKAHRKKLRAAPPAPWLGTGLAAAPPAGQPASSAMQAAAALGLGRIQAEQALEAAAGRPQQRLAQSSWGLYDRGGEAELAEIQRQQERAALERASEELARELAALEGVGQARLLKRSEPRRHARRSAAAS